MHITQEIWNKIQEIADAKKHIAQPRHTGRKLHTRTQQTGTIKPRAQRKQSQKNKDKRPSKHRTGNPKQTH